MSRRARLVCGNKIINTERFFNAVLNLDMRLNDADGSYDYQKIENAYIEPYNRSFYRLRDSLKLRDVDTTQVSLTELLGYVQYRSSTNRRDSIDGLYGIIKKFHIDFPLPDYSRSIKDIFTEAAKCVITHDKSLSLLIAITGEMTDFPSWVPDWSEDPTSFSSIVQLSSWDIFRASRKSASIFRFLNGDNCLSVQGVIIDTITCCTALAIGVPGGIEDLRKYLSFETHSAGTAHRFYFATQKQFQQWIVLVNNLNSHPYKRYPNGLTVNQALCRTLVLDYDQDEDVIELQENIEGDNPGTYSHPGFEEWLLAHSLGVSDELVKDIHTSLERRFPGKLPTLEEFSTASDMGVSDMAVKIGMLNLDVQRIYMGP
jgi:hypothetical protein